MLKNVASQSISALLLDTAGDAVTTGTTTVYVTGDAGTQASGGTATHEGLGVWSFLPSQANTNYDEVSFLFTNPGAVSSHLTVYPDAAYDRLGAPAGASIAADLVAIEGQTDDIGAAGAGLTAVPYNSAWDASINAQVDAAIETYHLHYLLHTTYNSASPPGVADSLLNEMTENNAGTTRFTAASLAQGPGGTPSQPLLHSTTILSLSSQTVFTLTDGSADDDAYNNQMIVVTDQSTGTQKAVGRISDAGGYVGASRQVTLVSDPGIFTMANGDTVEIWAVTGDSVGIEVDASGRVNLGKVFDVVQTPGDLAADITAIDVVVNNVEADLANSTDGLGALKTDIGTAQADLNTITGADGVILATSQPLYAPATAAALTSVEGKVDNVLLDTDELQSDDVPGLIAALNDISVTDVLTTQMTESYATDGTAPTLTQALMLIQQMLGDFSISGTTLTVNQVDGVSSAATFTLDDAANPTNITRAT